MDNNLILKTIEANNEDCPDFVYKNPLLDRRVASALAKSFMKILNFLDQNSRINNNLRLSILENIRRMCASGPQGHISPDETFTSTLTQLYEKHIMTAMASSTSDCVDKQLDEFLVRRFKEMDINSCFQSTLNPELVQALINLNDNEVFLNMLSKDIIHWHARNGNYMCLLRELWEYKPPNLDNRMCDDIALKMKSEIEKHLLCICLTVLTDDDIGNIFVTNSVLNELVKKCALSPICFQMCCGILNFIFIMTNFDPKMQIFIPKFISQIKSNVTGNYPLYPMHLSHFAILLDIEIEALPESVTDQYIGVARDYLHKLHEESENDLILMLSHYSQWYDIYNNMPA